MPTPAEHPLTRIGWRGDLPTTPDADGNFVARVIAQHRAGYQLHDGNEAFNAQPAARFLKADVDPLERPGVGDFVRVRPATPPVIETVLPRRTVLVRAAAGERHQRQLIAANVDSVLVLSGLDGDFNPSRIERYLLLVQGSGARAVVVLTKADLGADIQAALTAMRARLPAETEVIAINSKSPASIDALQEYLGPGMSVVLVGSSGVGKSTLTNTLLGEARQATASVRTTDSRGRHTTTYRALIQLPSGACLIDTPGMREIKLTGEEAMDGSQFGDIDELAQSCRFGDCSHQSEPGCNVRVALEDGRLDAARWHNYLKLRDELSAAAEHLQVLLRRKGEARGVSKSLGKRPPDKSDPS